MSDGALGLGEAAVFYDTEKKPIGYWTPQLGFVDRESAESGQFNWLEAIKQLPNGSTILQSTFPGGAATEISPLLKLRERI